MQQLNFGGVSNFRLTESKGLFRESQNARPSKILEISEDQLKHMISNKEGVLLSFTDVYSDMRANEIANQLFREEILT